MSITKFLLLTAALIVAVAINHPILGAPLHNSMNGRKVVLMSMDGFRYDYLSKANTPNFDALIASGAKVPYVNNTFTTLTFPCHYTIVTGCYEESHGIVDNKMYDPEFDAKFRMGNVETRWWNGAEPIWINAVKAGLKAGTYFWPGSEAKLEGLLPTQWRHYNASVPFKDRVDTLINDWLSKENFDLGIIYFNEPDHTGHMYGPDSPQIVRAIERMDGVLGYFMEKLEQQNLKDKVDFILTSDHGMTQIFQDKKIIGIKNQVDKSLLLDFVGGGAIAHLRPQPGKAKELARALSGIDHMTVYLKEDIPDRYHYKHHRRVMPVVVVADEGYEIRKYNYSRHLMKGTHGYSTDYMSMKPIFIASGPSFKQGVEVDPIKSVDIYPLLCHLLNLHPAPNNGSFDRVQALLRPASNSSVTPSIDRMNFTAKMTTAGVISPSSAATGDVNSPSSAAGDVTSPSSSAAGDVTSPSSSATGDVTSPSSSAAGDVASPSSSAAGDATSPSSAAAGDVTSPSSSAAGDATSPSSAAAGDVASPSSSAAGDVTSPSSAAAGDVTFSAAAGDVASPSSSAAGDVTSPSSAAAGDVTSPSSAAAGVTSSSAADDVTSPASSATYTSPATSSPSTATL